MIARRSKGPVAARPAAAYSVPPSRPMLDDAAFETFLHKRRPHPPVFGMDGLDGYLTTLIIGPRFIDPRQWIPLFAGEQALIGARRHDRGTRRSDAGCQLQSHLERACRHAGNLAPALCAAQ